MVMRLADEFALHTPFAVLYDEGTEYGASVDDSNSTEVHVFSGRVRVEPLEEEAGVVSTPTIIPSGSATRLNSQGIIPLPLADKKFLRRIPASDLPSVSPVGGLLVNEEFDYEGPILGNVDGGKGWAGPWRGGFKDFGPSQSQGVGELTFIRVL